MHNQGRPQDLGWGGAKNFFLRFGNLHVAKPCALLGGGSGACPLRKFLKMVQFGAFWCIFGSNFLLKKIQKVPFFISFL